MRGLWRSAAAAAAASALASAEWINLPHVDDVNSVIIEFPVPVIQESSEISAVLSFRVDVWDFPEDCGYGNFTVNGQELPHHIVDGRPIGSGLISVGERTVDANWDFKCSIVSKAHIYHTLEVTVQSIDGTDVEDVSFWVIFNQYASSRYLTVPTWINDPVESIEECEIKHKLAELEWTRRKLAQLEDQMSPKEEAIAISIAGGGLSECDSFKCVLETLYHKARLTAHGIAQKIYSGIAGEHKEKFDSFKKPHWWKGPFHRGTEDSNHSHNNHTCAHPPPRFPRCRPPKDRIPKGPPGKSPPLPPSSHLHQSLLQGPPTNWPSAEKHRKPSDHPHDLLAPPELDSPPLYSDLDMEFEQHISYSTPPSEWHGNSILQRLKTITGILLFGMLLFVLTSLLCCYYCCYYCCCRSSPTRRRAKAAKRAERHRRRAIRRAARKQAIKSWLARRLLRRSEDDLEEEERKRIMLAPRPTEIQDEEDIVGSEINEFRNAASFVSDMIIAAEEGRVSMDSRASLPDYVSQVGGERLPLYENEDIDEGELAGVVADGFRYAPGRSECDPGISQGGSVRDVLGDTKD